MRQWGGLWRHQQLVQLESCQLYLLHALDSGRFTREQIVQSIFTASALGLVIANKASISGAAGGCQAEIGSATAMAAGTLVELAGGTRSRLEMRLVSL